MRIDWDKQIAKQIGNIQLSDSEQKLLALVYNSIVGNYDPSKSHRIVRMLVYSYEVHIQTKEFKKEIGIKSATEIDELYLSLDKKMRFTCGRPTGKEDFQSFIILSGYSFSSNHMEFYVTERFIPMMQRYIKELVKPEYIEFLPLSEVFIV